MRLALPLCPLVAEGHAPAEPVTTCDPAPKPGVVMFRDWVMGQLGGADAGIFRACGEGPPSKHHEGRAWYWSPPDVATGQAVWEQLLERDAELARRAGLRTMIWAAVPPGGEPREPTIWIAARGLEPYTGSSPHTDHIHFGFGWSGARAETSLYQALGGTCPPLPSLPPPHPPHHPPFERPQRTSSSSSAGGVVVAGFAIVAAVLVARR